MKKLAIFALVAFTVVSFANPFSDVKFNHWAYDAVNQLSTKGIITGYPDGTFKGTKAVTRYDMAVIIARMLEKINTTPGLKAKMAKGDLDSVQKLVVEFADELSLLGVKVTALEDEMSAVKDDLAVLKEDVRTMKSIGGQGGKIRITGDVLMRFEDFNFGETFIETAQNENHFMDRLGLNLDMMIDPDVTACLRLERFARWNSTAGDWSTQKGGTGVGIGFANDTDLRTYLSYIQVKDFFGWADQMRFGRQRFAMGHDLLIKGVADGITFLKNVDKKRNIVARVGGVKFEDADTGTLGVARNDNEGLDLFYTDWTFDLKDVMAELYVINGRDSFSTTANGLRDATTVYKHVHRNTWYGLALSGNPVPELTLWGEYSWLKWDEDVDVDANGTTEDGDTGFLAGLNWDINKKTAFKLQYTKFEKWFFRPMGAQCQTIWDVDTYLDPEETYLYDAAGYRTDFDDIMAEISYQLTDKSTVVARYEAVDDNSQMTANQIADERNILTGIFKYQYKPNTALRLTYRRVDVNEPENITVLASSKTVVSAANQLNNVNNNCNTGTYMLGEVAGGAGIAIPGAAAGVANQQVDDVTLIRMQLDVNF